LRYQYGNCASPDQNGRQRQFPMDADPGDFWVLLAEDDPVSRNFLIEALRACGALVEDCANGTTALAMARARRWDLLLFDNHLPGLSGDAILTALAADAGACPPRPPAIAITAAPEDDGDALLAAGFAEVLPKPISLAALRAALDRHGGPTDVALDDAAALDVCGSPAIVARLRQLFADEELPRVQDELDGLGDDLSRFRPTLHRLRASCGFCGASALASASAALHHAVATGAGSQQVQTAARSFRSALAETRAALYARPLDQQPGSL
jgi:CheY-like chemotaxis protein